MIVEPGNSFEERTILSQEWTAAMEKLCYSRMNIDNRHLVVLHWPYDGKQPKPKGRLRQNRTMGKKQIHRTIIIQQRIIQLTKQVIGDRVNWDLVESNLGKRGRGIILVDWGESKSKSEMMLLWP